MGLKSTLGKTVGGLIRVNRSKDLAGDKERLDKLESEIGEIKFLLKALAERSI